jgi:GNAT superfamily N-acetyltransferase
MKRDHPSGEGASPCAATEQQQQQRPPPPAPPPLPPMGEDCSRWLPEHSLVLRYGTSLRLMASCSAFLNSSAEFNDVDPESDWEKWSTRIPDTFTLFYAAILDPCEAEGSGKAVHCCLRAVLDGWPTPTPPHCSRLIIDYVACRKESQGRGFASQLVAHVRALAAAKPANLYVLALEESCVWWMEKGGGFLLEQNENLNARLNIFPDVHLLRLASDPPDAGSPDDLALAAEEEEEEEEEEDGEDGEDGEGVGDAAAAGGGGLGQAALQMLGAAPSSAHDDEEAELQAALAMSLAHGSSSAAPAPSAAAVAAVPAPGGDVRNPVMVDVEQQQEEDAEMAAALALSMEPQGEGAGPPARPELS